MSNKKKHRKGSLFIRIYLIVFLLLFSAVGAGFIYLYKYLEDYQSCLPTNLAERVTQAYKDEDTDYIEKKCGNLPDVLKDSAVLKEYLDGSYDRDSLFYYEDSSAGSDRQTYVIQSGNRKVAVLVTEFTGDPTAYGHRPCRIVSLSQQVLRTYVIKAPGGAALMLNGAAISGTYLQNTEKITDEFASVGIPEIDVCTYAIKDLNFIKTLTADNCIVNKTADAADPDCVTYDISYELSDDSKKSISDFADRFTRTYVPFATKKNASPDAVLTMLIPDSDLYNSIEHYENDWGQTYDSDEYQNMTIDNFNRYAENAWSCDVSLKYVIKRSATEKSYDFAFTYYITDQSGDWRIIKMNRQ